MLIPDLSSVSDPCTSLGAAQCVSHAQCVYSPVDGTHTGHDLLRRRSPAPKTEQCMPQNLASAVKVTRQCCCATAGKQGPAQPTLQDFQSVILDHTRLQIQLKEVLWQSEFSLNERQVGEHVHTCQLW